MKINKFYVIAGHSYKFPGAMAYNSVYEHFYNLKLQKKIAKNIQDSSIALVKDTEDKNLLETITWINSTSSQGDFGLDIHFNFNHPTATGTEVFIHPNTPDKNREVASRMVNSISNILEIPVRKTVENRDFKYPTESNLGRLGIIENTRIPFILIEVCFLNSIDLPKYIGKEDNVSKAILESYNLNFRKS